MGGRFGWMVSVSMIGSGWMMNSDFKKKEKVGRIQTFFSSASSRPIAKIFFPGKRKKSGEKVWGLGPGTNQKK